MKILICGDSFMADWSVKYPGQSGWSNWLCKDHQVTNVAQAGAGEYKIWKQVERANLSNFDAVLISHTSPNRIHCVEHPVHSGCPLHKNADLIYADISNHAENTDAEIAKNFYGRYFDFDYASDVSNMFCEKILDKFSSHSSLPVWHLQCYRDNRSWRRLFGGASYHGYRYPMIGDHFNLGPVLHNHHGLINHLNNEGHQCVYNEVTRWLAELE
jgi:hypothetical protein